MRLTPNKRSHYEEFVAAHGDGLVKLAYAICGDRARAEDAVQEALTCVYRRWSRLRDPLAYARRTAIHATYDDWRRSQRTERAYRQAAQVTLGESNDPQERLLANGALMDALDQLPDGQRAVIVLRYGSQLSEAETAATLDITTGTVKSQTARALARMRDLLSPPESADHELEYSS